MAMSDPTDRATRSVQDLDVLVDPVQMIWRVATFEYDRTTDHLYWLDSPLAVLNIDEDSAQLLVEPIVVSLRQGAPWEHYDLEREVDDRDHKLVDMRVQARRVLAPDGRVSGCVGVVIDVSEQRRTERELRGIVDRYRRLVELSPDCIAVHQDGVLRYVNPAGVRMAGAEDPSQIVGRPILDFIHPASLEQTLERIATLTEPGMASEPAEALVIRLDGTPVPVESVSVRTEWEGEPAFQVILRDISDRRRAEAALRYRASLVAHVSDAIIATDPDGSIQSWNPAAETLYGRSAAQVLGRSIAEVLGSRAVGPDGTPLAGEVGHVGADGRQLKVLASVAPVRDELGADAGVVAVCADLTERIELRAAEGRFSAVVAALEEGVLVVDAGGAITSVNASARSLLGEWLEEGITVEQFVGRWALVANDGRRLEHDDHPLLAGLGRRESRSREVIGLVDHGRTRWFSMSVQLLANDGTGGVVCSFSEITDRRRVEEQLNFQATHDPLTRLPNRALIVESLWKALARARARGSYVAVHVIDLDRFKAVNDSLGHVAGDDVLREISKRVRVALPEGDRLGRLAGDEFVVVSVDVPSVEQARALAESLAEVVRSPVRLRSGREVIITASIGVALASGERDVPETLLSQADQAMYQAKQRGRARVELFDEELRSSVSRRFVVQAALRHATEQAEIEPFYQPIVSVTTGRVVGFEALARWVNGPLGAVSPSEFIPIAEDTGMMVALGSRILRTACADAGRLPRDRRYPEPMISVNVSARQLADRGFVDVVARSLEQSELDPGRLWLEVTESVLIEDAPFVSAALGNLRGLGVHFAIDDFGTGYSSLAYLRRLPVEAVKVDRSFVEGLGVDAESDAIVEAILRLAQSLELQTIAEGVESELQLARLHDLGCDLVQGFLFSEARRAEDLSFNFSLVGGSGFEAS